MCEDCGCSSVDSYTVHLDPAHHAGGSHSHHGHGHDHGHGSHAHYAPTSATIPLNTPILAQNDRIAERNRGFLKAKGITALNLISSPGSGKTTLLARTLEELDGRCPAAVIVGDLATDNDARRLRERSAEVLQITTGTACHLDASMVARALDHLDLANVRLLFIENVGNLVCPAAFDLGEALRVALLSCTEGEDKPLKYPPLFGSAHAVVLTKTDLAEAAGFDIPLALANLDRAAPSAPRFPLSSRTGDGFPAWIDFLTSLPRS